LDPPPPAGSRCEPACWNAHATGSRGLTGHPCLVVEFCRLGRVYPRALHRRAVLERRQTDARGDPRGAIGMTAPEGGNGVWSRAAALVGHDPSGGTLRRWRRMPGPRRRVPRRMMYRLVSRCGGGARRPFAAPAAAGKGDPGPGIAARAAAAPEEAGATTPAQ